MPTEAQAMQDAARAKGEWLYWYVAPAAHRTAAPGAFVLMARAHTADHRGGTFLPRALVASTLDELHRMMPAGLTRRDRVAGDPVEILEVWD